MPVLANTTSISVTCCSNRSSSSNGYNNIGNNYLPPKGAYSNHGIRQMTPEDIGYSQEALRIAGVIIVAIVIAFIVILFALLVCSKVRSLRIQRDTFMLGDRAGIGPDLETITGGPEYTTTNGNNMDDEENSSNSSDRFYCKPISSTESID